MSLSYKARRGWALVILVIGMPVYVVAAISLVGLIERPSFLVELLIYLGLGFLWALPFRFIFRGIGQADPAEKRRTGKTRPPETAEMTRANLS